MIGCVFEGTYHRRVGLSDETEYFASGKIMHQVVDIIMYNKMVHVALLWVL